ncbi:tripartite motif-containing protein 14 [Trichomycterus rosablanca]|uniref:tripartite motif-containing protein 14 n=1 Tax=Trichomycterus rosablanca TaxID=2290929 RepID=UPI002F3572E1
MGSSFDKPGAGPAFCPLCRRESSEHITLGCGHIFCKRCLGELWRGLCSGPCYCPECNFELLQIPELRDTDEASTSAESHTRWPFGQHPLANKFTKKNLGKRKRSSDTFEQNSGGYRLGTGSSNNNSSTASDASDETPAKKAKETSSGTSSTRNTHCMPSTADSRPDNLKEDGEPHVIVIDSSDDAWHNTSAVLCHYCSSREKRAAVKTCLVCGASMCPEHLRVHLESPVFQSHPLVDAVDDVSPWRCLEHQEMNRIYCCDCEVCVCTVCTVIGLHKEHACISLKEAEKKLRAELKCKMKKLQTKEGAISDQLKKLTEKKRSVQENLESVRANVVQQYKAMKEALELEEQQALLCVTQEQNKVHGSVDAHLGTLNKALKTIQGTFEPLLKLADAQGASQLQDQAFIMEYKKITEGLNSMPDSVEKLESVEEVNQGRLDCLQDWTDERLSDVIISMPHRDPFRLLYGCSPSLDPDTAHPKLALSSENMLVEYTDVIQDYPDLESRFSIFPQVLGTTALSQGRHYWEVEVTVNEGRWKVGVSDQHIGRKGQKDNCRLGFYPNSWCLVCEKGKVEALHNKETWPVCATGLQKVGLFLDFEEGSLSFYSVGEGGSLSLMYSFQHAFSEPLYPALAASKAQLSICDLFVRPITD